MKQFDFLMLIHSQNLALLAAGIIMLLSEQLAPVLPETTMLEVAIQ